MYPVLVRVVQAVLVTVTQLRFVYALWQIARRTLRTEVFARARKRGAVQLVLAVLTVGVSVALVVHRDAQSVSTRELGGGASSEILRKKISIRTCYTCNY